LFIILVVDTSAIIAVITNEESKTKLINITKGEDLIAPSSLHWEIGNAFSSMFKRKIITLKLAMKALDYYSMIPLRMVEIDIYKSLEISNRYNIYAYDAYFLECAKSYNAPLVTLDKGLLEVAKKMNINVSEV
jgi:predicted nucleic acid-binding protein